MRLPNQRYLARLKRIDRLSIRHFVGVLLLALIFLAGCAGGAGSTRFSNLFGGASPRSSPSDAEIPIATPTPAAAPAAAEAPARTSKKVAKQARAASENAAAASKDAANASAAAALASKQAASVANRIEGSGPSNADVSLESNSAVTAEGAPVSAASNRATPASSPALKADPVGASVTHSTPTLNSPALDTASATGESNPAKATRLIQNVDAMDKRVDRKNLTADDSQRDILAQSLLQKAKKALEDRDSVAAMSLATKASTLFAPLPKLTASSPQN
jgi:hypothetical protein